MKSLLCLAVALATTSAATRSQGSVIVQNNTVQVSLSTTRPDSGHVIISHELPEGSTGAQFAARWNTGSPDTPYRQDGGQTFKPTSDFVLGKVTILANRDIEVSNLFTITIESFTEMSRERPNFSVAATPVAVLSGNLLPTALANTYITFDLTAAGIELEANKLYGFRFGFDEQRTDSLLRFTYLGGQGASYYEKTPSYTISYDNATGAADDPSRVNGIAVYYITAAIPEPTSFTMLGTGAILAGSLLYRRIK